jgi:hypothetical protein
MTAVSRIAVTLVLAATAVAAPARSPAPTTPARAARSATRSAEAARPVGPTGVVLPAADPMAVEMQREIERSQHEYAALFQRLSLAQAESEAFEIQEDMRQERTSLQIGLLRIQAAYARRAGRNAFADQLERAIAALVAPDAPPAPAPDRQRQL